MVRHGAHDSAKAPLINVWWATLTAADHSLQALVSPWEWNRAQGLDNPADTGRSLVGAALLRVAAAGMLGERAEQISIDRTCEQCVGQHGGPRLTRGHASVSHSGLVVGVAVSRHVAVGIDVERNRDFDAQRKLRGPNGGASGSSVREWTEWESLLKAGHDCEAPLPEGCRAHVLMALDPPLPGYTASLAAPVSLPLDVVEHDGNAALSGSWRASIRQQR